MSRILSALLVIFLHIPVASALSVDVSSLPYSDVDASDSESVSIVYLTDFGVLTGNPDGTFRSQRTLNRAEFVAIAMRLYNHTNQQTQGVQDFCFPDVVPDAWYAYSVCRAKNLGFVQGNAQEGVPASDWLFAPGRTVQYEEALKILVETYNLALEYRSGDQWFDPYLRAAARQGVALDLSAGAQLRRGQMAQLAARFEARKRGELDELLALELNPLAMTLAAESSSSSSSSSSLSSLSSSSSSSSSTTLSVSSSSSSSVAMDPNLNDDDSPDFLLLGTTSSVLGAAKIFSNTEPIDVNTITITFTTNVSGYLDHLMVYDQDAIILGKATQDSTVSGGATYRLQLKTKNVQVPYRDDYSFYVRPVLRPFDVGGESGKAVQVSSFTVEGDGAWSNRTYTKSSSDTFSVFQTARSRIDFVGNADISAAPLIAGPDLELGSFRFEGIVGDSRADLRVTDLVFQIEQVGGVTVSNVTLSADATSQEMLCSVASSTITCSSIDPVYGSLEDRSRVITLYGDVSIPSDAEKSALRLSLNQPGDISNAGSVTWTDGTTTFSWVQFSSPVVRGTYYNQ